MLEKLGIIAKKYLFSVAVIIAGIILVLKGVSADEATSIMQTEGFLYGGLAILFMGIITLLYIMEVINRMVHLILMFVLFGVTVTLTVMTINSVKTTIDTIELKDKTDLFVKQGLSDIRDIQVEYKKKYGKYAKTFSGLSNFLLKDSIMDIVQSFGNGYSEIPEGRITNEHAAILGYNLIRDDKLLESYDETEALGVGILINDTIYRSVMEVVFTNDDALKKERAYMFEAANLERVPMNDTATFIMQADTIDDGTPVFMAKDPYPFDPFNTKDTLIIGSMKESKNTGNWRE